MVDIESKLDAIVYDPRWLPRCGWHDDHRHHDGTPDYLPAVMQVRAEFLAFVDQLSERRTACLQLGLGPCNAPHELWHVLFEHVLTIDTREILYDDDVLYRPGASTHDHEETDAITDRAGYFDLLFVDAGHSYDDVSADYRHYSPLVRPGGLIAFHDALPRAAYPEVEVHRFLAELDGVTVVGDEVGTAWITKR